MDRINEEEMADAHEPTQDETMEQEEEEDESSEEEEEEDEEEGDGEDDSKAYVPGSAELGEGEELAMDESAYVIYHQANLGPPCLSFDVIENTEQGQDNKDPGAFPLTVYGVAGTQAAKANGNSIITFKMSNLHPIQRKNDDADNEDEEDEDEDDTSSDPEKQPKLKVASIKHTGAINRIKYKTLGSSVVAAVWAETGSVGVWSLNNCLQKLEQPLQSGKDWYRETTSPLFNFKGHLTEGFALNWSPTVPGVLASGDCRKNIHLWTPAEAGTWIVDQRPLGDHKASVEDIQWSPNEANVMASCSVDKSLKIWDCRAKPDQACMLTINNSHESDVNVIDWNKNEPFIVSGGDDGFIKVWDLRQFDKGEPVASFKHHSAPITSVEWHPTDATVLASSGADDQVCLWDLSLERDEEEIAALANSELKDLPPQLLFIHQGLKDIKEIHWHKQIPGMIVSTSHTGFDVFKTISV